MTPTLIPILGLGTIIVIALAYLVLPRFIVVTGPDKLSHKDVPQLNRYIQIILITQSVLLFAAVLLDLPQYLFERVVFTLLLVAMVLVMLLERKYLPGTKHYLVTLFFIVGMILVFGLYVGVTYF